MRSVAGRIARRTPGVARVVQQRDELAARVERLERRVANLTRPAREDLSFVFIVTYGRSGSTLLQGLLDSIPGWLIRGENAGSVYPLFQHHKLITERPQSRPRPTPTTARDPWFGLDGYPRQQALRELRALVLDTLLRPEPDTRVTGFKEIRWQSPDLVDYLEFLRLLFPGARFVFNTRDHEKVVASWQKKGGGWADRDRDAQLVEVARIEKLQLAAADALGDAAYRVHFDDYVADVGALRGLFDWLGEEYDEPRLRAVMETQHSY
ncbi:sulfotransferase [Nocardioides sp. DS6]|uniref:Sulfotransferase n=1 Tax=Nocardioides eburneus TaxID=3231482 RepID=A0ABV3SUZ1_9ACTN